MYRCIIDKVWATQPPANPEFWFPPSVIPYQTLPGVGPVNFFEQITNAADGVERLNVVREMFRLLTPNSNAFSKLNDDADPENVQVRHIWAQMMIAVQDDTGIPALPPNVNRIINYFKYRPDFWYGPDFETSIADFVPPPSLEPIDNVDPTSLFEFSVEDNDPQYNDGTVVQKQNSKVQPVFAEPVYAPFGLGYRRCPGEIFSYFMTEKLLIRFAGLEWEFRPPTIKPNTPCDPQDPILKRHIPIAPRTAPFNNLFVKNNLANINA